MTVVLGWAGFWRWLVARLRVRWGLTLILFAGLLVELGYQACFSLGLKFLIDDAILPADSARMVLILGLLAVGVAVAASVAVLRDYLYARLGASILNELRAQLFAHLQRLPLDYFARTSTGDVLSRFSADLASVEFALVYGVPQAFLSPLLVLASLGLMGVLEWRLAVLALLGLPLCLLGPKLLNKRASSAQHRFKEALGGLTGHVQENLQGQAVVKAYGLQAEQEARFGNRLAELFPLSVRASFLAYLLERTPSLGMRGFQLLTLSLGAWLALRGELTLGRFAAAQALAAGFGQAVCSLTGVLPGLLQAIVGLERIEAVLREPPHVSDRPGAPALPQLARSLTLEQVTFGHTPGQPNLCEISLEIPRGAHVALVGASGSGKSTLLSLLLRFYDPQAGAVRCDGQDLRTVMAASWRSQCAVVFQDNFLFDAPVSENLRLGRPGASDAELVAVAKAAAIHEAIMDLPHGYDTLCGQRGGRFSGGQRQRLAIARALLRDPAVLLLDEATSALDPATEEALNQTLREAARGRTVVTVTHRLAAVTAVDRIFVLEKGRLAECGTHRELLARDGPYARLWKKQSGFTLLAGGAQARVSLERLRLFPLLERLETAQLEALATRFATERGPAGWSVIQEGEAGDKFYIIVRGKVRVTKRGSEGEEVELAVLQDGDHFGEVALLHASPRTASIVTITDCVLLSLQREAFGQLLEQAPELLASLQAEAATRRSSAEELLRSGTRAGSTHT